MQQLAYDFSHLKKKVAAIEQAPKNTKNARLTLRRLSSAEYPGLRRLSAEEYPVLKRLSSADKQDAQGKLSTADQLEMQGLSYAEYPGLFE
jgi:hypothetical protein